MKKILRLSLVLVLTASTSMVFAQKKDLQTSKNRLKAGEYKEALEYFDKAMSTGKLDKSADAYNTKYRIYKAIAKNQPELDPDAEQKSTDALIKMLKIDPKYDLITNATNIDNLVNSSFADGIASYTAKDYKSAIESFDNFSQLYELTRETLYEGAPVLDTFNAKANLYKAYAYQEDGQTEMAAETMAKLKTSPYLEKEDKVNLYKTLLDGYIKSGDEAMFQATIAEANKALPGNSFTTDYEINFYSSKGETDKLLDKINKAIETDPQNAVMYYNKGVILSNMINPEDGGEAPENSSELMKEAVTSLAKAEELDPTNPNITYMEGFLYYNEALKLNTQIATASDSEVEGLAKAREEFFAMGLPFMEKTYQTINNYSAADLPQEYLQTTNNVGIALKAIYGLNNQMDKINEVNAFLEKFGLK